MSIVYSTCQHVLSIPAHAAKGPAGPRRNRHISDCALVCKSSTRRSTGNDEIVGLWSLAETMRCDDRAAFAGRTARHWYGILLESLSLTRRVHALTGSVIAGKTSLESTAERTDIGLEIREMLAVWLFCLAWAGREAPGDARETLLWPWPQTLA